MVRPLPHVSNVALQIRPEEKTDQGSVSDHGDETLQALGYKSLGGRGMDGWRQLAVDVATIMDAGYHGFKSAIELWKPPNC